MELDDRVTVATPEGVDLDLVVVGLGSRFLSSLVDTTLQLVLIIPLLFGAAVAPAGGAAIGAVGSLLVLFAVPAAFDAFGAGRTPGRRLAGTRLVMSDGSRVGVLPAAVRNVVRVIDLMPGAYGVGAITILATPRNQRLGDLAADTIVVREAQTPTRSPVAVPGAVRAPVHQIELPPEARTWDLSAVTARDVEVLRSFLGRRAELEPASRQRVASELARRLAPVVVGPTAADDEELLALILAAKDARAR